MVEYKAQEPVPSSSGFVALPSHASSLAVTRPSKLSPYSVKREIIRHTSGYAGDKFEKVAGNQVATTGVYLSIVKPSVNASWAWFVHYSNLVTAVSTYLHQLFPFSD